MPRFMCMTAILVLLGLAGCANVIGNSCELPGAMNEEVAYLTGVDECDDSMCLYYENYGTFCTDDCVTTDDCPNGFVCETIDMLPTALEEWRSLCIPEEPIGDDDDDSYEPWGEAPVISELSVWSAPDEVNCLIWHRFHWTDVDGDLNGAIGKIEFIDPADPDNPHKFNSNIEQLDTVETDLQFYFIIDGENLAYDTSYAVYVEIEDRAGNDSNQLAEGGFTTPSAACE